MEVKGLFSTDSSSSKSPLFARAIETIMPTLMGLNKNELQSLYRAIEDRMKPVGIKVVLNSSRRPRTTGYCDVIFKLADGSETIVDFAGRTAKVLYVYTLMNANGVERSSIGENRELAHLFSKMYHLPVDKLTGIEGQGLNQAIAQARAAISKAIGINTADKDFVFHEYMSRKLDTLVVPFAKNGGHIEFVNF